MRSVIQAGVIVPINNKMEVWRPGFLIIADGRIVASGPGGPPEGTFDEVIDLPNGIVMPGLVNAHAHSPSNLVKGLWSRLPLEIWRQYIRAAWREYSDEALYVSAQLGAVEMLKTGCTCVLDHFYSGSHSPYMGALQAVQAMQDVGMRGAVALTVSDRDFADTVDVEMASLTAAAREEMKRITEAETAETLDDFPRFVDEVRKRSPIVIPMIGPSAPHRCSASMLSDSIKLARTFDTAVHIHVAETKGQFLQSQKLFGVSPVVRLERAGVLDERLSMAHCVWLTDADVRLVAERGVTVIHNPTSNGKLGSGRMRFDDMLRAGVRVGLATDGSGSNDNQNMFEAMRLAGVIHNSNQRDYQEWPAPEQILRGATVNGAFAFGLGGKLGSLRQAQLADLVVLTRDSFHFAPLNDVLNQLVYCENGMSVTDVMVNGEWVVRGRALCRIDEHALYRRAQALRDEMQDRLGAQFRQTAELEPALRAGYLRMMKSPWSPAS
jgi:cytosine/adenosine deaminase-related metal-dependent hydrolase